MNRTAIHTLDLQFLGAQRAIASFLLIGPDGPVLVESGPGSTLPALLAGLAQHGLKPADVRHVLVTHIHLDHAGAAGWWAQQGATVYVHHVGAPHLVQPERLLASARRIYGDMMDVLWGEFLPAPAERVHALRDGDVVEAAGLRLTAVDTPGHARHHMVYQLGDAAFVGDVAGVRRPDSPYVDLPTPPPEFDLEAWLNSLARLRAQRLGAIYLTHFGDVPGVDEQLGQVEALLLEFTGRVRAGLEVGHDRDTILKEMTAWAETRLEAAGVNQHDWPIYASLAPVSMSVDGVLRYWHKQGVE
jgi:glyoxylase-like metal-dependent hydrolase (beta-lactamase superfamily II)